MAYTIKFIKVNVVINAIHAIIIVTSVLPSFLPNGPALFVSINCFFLLSRNPIVLIICDLFAFVSK
jgi:hypothetical protein